MEPRSGEVPVWRRVATALIIGGAALLGAGCENIHHNGTGFHSEGSPPNVEK